VSARLVKLSPAALLFCLACGAPIPAFDAGIDASSDAAVSDSGVPDAGPRDAGAGPFAARVVSFDAGAGAGFGNPQLVFGPPQGGGDGLGSFDFLSLGNGGGIILALDDLLVSDGPGVDLLVFENAFVGFIETGAVAVSDDGATWHEWPCAADDPDAGYPGCAGVHPVYSSTASGISPTDPLVAGGDGFDLATLGLTHARYVRIRDSGKNRYVPTSGGFDLDAIAVVHPLRPDGGPW